MANGLGEMWNNGGLWLLNLLRLGSESLAAKTFSSLLRDRFSLSALASSSWSHPTLLFLLKDPIYPLAAAVEHKAGMEYLWAPDVAGLKLPSFFIIGHTEWGSNNIWKAQVPYLWSALPSGSQIYLGVGIQNTWRCLLQTFLGHITYCWIFVDGQSSLLWKQKGRCFHQRFTALWALWNTRAGIIQTEHENHCT